MVAAIALSQLSFIIIQCSLQIINFIGNMHGGNNLTLNCSKYYVQIPILFLACKQALHLWDIVKSRRARGTRKETRKRGLGKRKAFPQPLAQLNRRACSQVILFPNKKQLRYRLVSVPSKTGFSVGFKETVATIVENLLPECLAFMMFLNHICNDLVFFSFLQKFLIFSALNQQGTSLPR